MFDAATLGPAIRDLSMNIVQQVATVTFKSKTGQGAFTSYTLPLYVASASDKDMILGGKMLRTQRVTVRIFQSDLTEQVASDPKVNDELVVPFLGTMVIETATRAMLGTVWVCECQITG